MIIEPKVLAMVLSVRIAEIVSSRPCLSFSSRRPRPGLARLRASISATVVLRMIASASEHANEMLSVRTIARTSQDMGPTI